MTDGIGNLLRNTAWNTVVNEGYDRIESMMIDVGWKAEGYTMIGKIETNNSETATPQGVLIIGNVTYRSRKVGIPADQKTPNTGSYKRVKRKTLFGTEETTTTWDYTSGSDKDAETALKAFQERQKAEEDADKEKQTSENVR